MSPHNVIQRALFAAIDEVNLQLPPEHRLSKSAGTVLFGAGGLLDSLGFVNLVVSAEDTLEQLLGHHVNLADRILSTSVGRACTVAQLVDFIAAMIGTRTHA